MSVVLQMKDGSSVFLDRRLFAEDVAKKINEARVDGNLISFELDLTPTGQIIYIDPNEVSIVRNDR